MKISQEVTDRFPWFLTKKVQNTSIKPEFNKGYHRSQVKVTEVKKKRLKKWSNLGLNQDISSSY